MKHSIQRLRAIRRSFVKHAPADRQAGFTLVELLVVLVILVLLATLITPRVIGYLSESKIKAAKVQIESLSSVVELFAIDVGRYPTTQEGLDALIRKPGGVDSWRGPYMNKTAVPLDPWGHPYHYRSPGHRGTFDIVSYGRDNKEGGEGEDADITN
jgi:general secretion pathway protein G